MECKLLVDPVDRLTLALLRKRKVCGALFFGGGQIIDVGAGPDPYMKDWIPVLFLLCVGINFLWLLAPDQKAHTIHPAGVGCFLIVI